MNRKFWVFVLGVVAGGYFVLLVAINMFPSFSVFALVAFLFGVLVLAGQVFRCPHCNHTISLRVAGIFFRPPGKECKRCGKPFDAS